jgi:hypothetical protein
MTKMDPERERLARKTMAADYDEGPMPRPLPAWNESVKTILALERAINGGYQISEVGIDY